MVGGPTDDDPVAVDAVAKSVALMASSMSRRASLCVAMMPLLNLAGQAESLALGKPCCVFQSERIKPSRSFSGPLCGSGAGRNRRYRRFSLLCVLCWTGNAIDVMDTVATINVITMPANEGFHLLFGFAANCRAPTTAPFISYRPLLITGL